MPLLLGVYSASNAGRVADVVQPARQDGWEVRLHALDEPHTALADVTRSAGRGARLENLNAALAEGDGLPRWVVLCDDDVQFVRGDVVRLVAECAAAGFGLAQPAHAPGSHVSHPHTRQAPRSRSRVVTYVEAGPVAVVAPAWSQRVLPLPAWRGMGWGLELEWMDLVAEGCVLGVVDRVTYLHLEPVGGTYDEQVERAQMAADLAARGIDDLARAQATIATWRPWRRRPPWAR